MDDNSTVRGIVTDCLRLSVRERPESFARAWNRVMAVIPALTWVTVDLDKSTDEFYKIRTDDGFEGFCRKKNIAIPRGG